MTKKRFTLKESDIYNRNDVIHDNGIEMPQSTVCDLLNSLNGENVKLRARNKYLAMKIQRERNIHVKEHEKWEEEIQKENEQLKEALIELKEIGDYQEGRIKELNDENEHLESELGKVVEVCRKYGIYKEELQHVLADFDKMLNENGERAIRYKYCVNSR